MPDVKWIKITTDIFDDEKILLIESLPDSYAIITAWFKLLCLAGKMNNSGVFLMSNRIAYTDKMLATIFRMKESTVTMALQTFEQFGMVELVDGVITIPNWDKHQSLDAYEAKKERDRLYQAERRQKQKQIAEKSSDSQTIQSSDVAKNRFAEEEREEEKNKNKNKNKNNKDPFSSFKESDPDLYAALKDYESMRKAMKKPMTGRSKEMLLSKLGSFPDEQWIPMLNEAINHNWLSVYPLKENAGFTKPKNKMTYGQTQEEKDEFNAMLLDFVKAGE